MFLPLPTSGSYPKSFPVFSFSSEKWLKQRVLLPIISNKIRKNRSEIIDYFLTFLEKVTKAEVDELISRRFGDIAISSGVYTFSFDDGASVIARYTFVYMKDGYRWKILEHHSSKLPDQP